MPSSKRIERETYIKLSTKMPNFTIFSDFNDLYLNYKHNLDNLKENAKN